jgi:TonB-linked SusC/RagA family outer membrane protein
MRKHLLSCHEKISLLLLSMFFLWPGMLWAQERTISGTVTAGDTNEPLPGVNILVQGTTRGTITDISGNYQVSLESADEVLVFSYIGYEQQEIQVGNQSTIDVVLQVDARALEEIVVIGYGTVRKSDLTGSVSTVKAEDIAKVPAGNAAQALQGKVSGLQVQSPSGEPGANPIIRLRGVTTLNNNDPIFVVDGVITEDISFLSSSDIESMEVLKDASATAIFGSRGSNGVIMVTTKSGTEMERPRINLSYEMGLESVENQLSLMNGRQFATYVNEFDPGTFNNLNALPDTDWQDLIFEQNAPIHKLDLSVSGAAEKLDYYFGGSYYSQEGIIDKSSFERVSLKSNTNYKVREFLSLGSNLTLSYINKENAPGVVPTAYRAWPIDVPYNEDGTYAEVNGGNALAAIEFHNSNQDALRLLGNVFAEATFLQNFRFKTSFQIDAEGRENRSFAPVYFVGPLQQNEESDIGVSTTIFSTWIWENTLNYNLSLEKHNLDALLGYTSQLTSYEMLRGDRRNLLREDEDFWYLDAGQQDFQTNSNNAFKNAIASYLFRVNYAYDSRYIGTITFRRDGSSKFGGNNRYANFPAVAVGWNIYNESFFPQTTFLDKLKLRASWGIIGNEKIAWRAQYSTVAGGIDAVLGNPETLNPGASLTNLGNPDLKWEETEQFDVGLEFNMFNSRLVAEFDYYRKETEGILVDLRVPAHMGIGSFQYTTFNAADVLNSGFEFNLNWTDEINDFTYEIGVIGSTVHNEVISLGTGTGQDSVIVGGSFLGQNVARTVEGRSIGFFYGWQIDGVFQDQEELSTYPHLSQQGIGDFRYVDTDGNGVMNEADKVQLGTWIPDFIYGFNLNFGYKGFNLSLDFQGQTGNSIYNAKEATRFSLLNWETKYNNYWTGPGSTNEHPRPSSGGINYQPSNYFVENGSYLRLRTAQLSYTFDAEFLSRIRMRNAMIYVRGTNLFTLTDYSGYSPEIGVGNPIDGALDQGIYPITRIYSAGINLTF